MATNLPLSDSLRHTVGRSWWVILLFGIVSALFGVMALVNPLSMGASMTWAIGILAVAEGVVGLIGAFGKNAGVSRGWLIPVSYTHLVVYKRQPMHRTARRCWAAMWEAPRSRWRRKPACACCWPVAMRWMPRWEPPWP